MKKTRRNSQLVQLLGLVALVTAGPMSAARAEGNKLLPYWAQPFPTNYVGGKIPPDAGCYVWRDVQTLFGWRRERVWICESAVRERY